jgi:hypothetical protein
MNVLRTWLIAVVAAAGLWLAVAPGYAQVNIQLGLGNAQINLGAGARGGFNQCLNDRQIARAIANGEIRSWPEIRQLAGIPASYHETSDVKVCMRGDAPYYVVNMVSPKGENVKYVLNALDGSG